MRMVSKTKDYYDGVIRNTISDKTHTFVREKKEIGNIDTVLTRHYDFETSKDNIDIYYEVLGFCGEIYPCIRVETSSLSTINYKTSTAYYYTPEDVDKHIPFSERRETRRMWRWGEDTQLSDKVKNWLKTGSINTSYWESKGVTDAKNDSRIKDIFLNHRIAYFHIGKQTKRGDAIITAYPILKDVGFCKVLDPYTCFQKIEIFLNNEIVKPDEIPQHIQDSITDELKAHSHGYDKWSFRKEPSKKK